MESTTQCLTWRQECIFFFYYKRNQDQASPSDNWKHPSRLGCFQDIFPKQYQAAGPYGTPQKKTVLFLPLFFPHTQRERREGERERTIAKSIKQYIVLIKNFGPTHNGRQCRRPSSSSCTLLFLAILRLEEKEEEKEGKVNEERKKKKERKRLSTLLVLLPPLNTPPPPKKKFPSVGVSPTHTKRHRCCMSLGSPQTKFSLSCAGSTRQTDAKAKEVATLPPAHIMRETCALSLARSMRGRNRVGGGGGGGEILFINFSN